MPPTKFELAQELRELNRGLPRMPISQMRYHELEASIDTIKKMKATSDDSLNNFLPTARGPKGSRYVPVREKEVVQEEEEGNFIMNVPEVPAKQKAYSDNKKPPAPKKKPETATDSPKKGPGRPPKAKLESSAPKEEKRKSDPVVAHFCNCPNCDRK